MTRPILAWAALLLALGCGARSRLDDSRNWSTGGATGATGGVNTGGVNSGGVHTGGAPTGGTWFSTYYSAVPGSGGVNTGGTLSTSGTHAGGASSTGGTHAGGTSSTGGMHAGGMHAGGTLNTGGSFTGGTYTGTTPSTSGTPLGGAFAGGTRSTGGSNTGGAASGGVDATGGTGACAVFDGGSPTDSDAGLDNPYLDPAGDATDPRGDILEAHVYLTESTIEAQLRFASVPVPPNLSLRISVASATEGFEFWLARGDSELLVRSYARNATLSYETCSTARINPVTGWLTVSLPALVLPDSHLTTFEVASEYVFNYVDKMDCGPLPVQTGPGPDRDTDAVCEPSSRVRKSTVRFKQVSLGWDFGCGLDLTGAALCWGTDQAMGWVGSTPSGTFEQIAVANQWFTNRIYACGRRSTGAVECWGDQAPEISLLFAYMAEPFGCGVDSIGNAECIDDNGNAFGFIRMSGAAYIDTTGSADKYCTLTNTGMIYCAAITPPAGNDFIALEFGNGSDACGLRKNGTLVCGGGHLPPLVFDQFDTPNARESGHFGCGLQPGGVPLCWGEAGIVVPVAPGPFKHIEVSTSGEGVCGFKDDDTLECWHYGYVAGDPIPATTPP